MWKPQHQRRPVSCLPGPVDRGAESMVRASPLRVYKTVFWSFLGVRKGADNQDDLAGISPVQIVVAGVIGAIVFVISLIALVSFITR